MTGDRGATALFTVVIAVILFGVAALVVDLGQMYTTRRAAQTSADMAALAGGQYLPNDSLAACREAIRILLNNPPGSDPLTVSPADCDSSGNTPDGTVKVKNIPVGGGAIPAEIRVVVPKQTIQFAFSGALNAIPGVAAPIKGEASAAATARLFSSTGILPFALCLDQMGFVRLKPPPPGKVKDDPESCDAATGNFAFLDISRSATSPSFVSGKGTQLENNMRFGVDHTLSIHPSASRDDAGDECEGGADDSIDPGAPEEPDFTASYNCVDVQTGFDAMSMRRAFVELPSAGGDCSGRFSTNIPSGNPTRTDLAGSDCPTNAQHLQAYLKSCASVTVGLGTDPPVDCWNNSIWQDPLFFIVPVLNTVTRPPNGVYPIVDFFGFFVDCDTETLGLTCGGTSAYEDEDFSPSQSVTGYAFKLRTSDGRSTIAGPPSGPAGTTYFGGSGVPKLVQDEGDEPY